MWVAYALMASMSWGIVYVLIEKVLKLALSPYAILLVNAVLTFPFYALLFFASKKPQGDVQTITENPSILAYLGISSFFIVFSNFLILFAVQEKNATLVSIIEITYPLFTFIFAMWILKEVQLTLPTCIGGMFIMLGIGIVLLKG